MISQRLAALPLVTKLDVHMREILGGAFIAFLLKAVAAGASFGFSVLLARILGAHGAGIYFQALTLTTIAAVLGRVGLSNTLVRFTAANAAISDWGKISGLHRKSISIAFVASGFAALLLAGNSQWISEAVFSEPQLGSITRWMSLTIVPATLSYLYAHLLKGLKRIAAAISIESVTIPFVALVGTLIAVPPGGIHAAVSVYTVAVVLNLIFALALWRKAAPPISSISGHFDTRELLQSSVPLFLMTLVQLVNQSASTIMLGMWENSTEVGIFSAANRTSSLTSFVLIAVNSIAAPKFAALSKQGDLDALRRTAQDSAKLMALAAGLPLLLFLFFPGWIMSIFGPQFVSGKMALSILSLGQFVNVVTGSVGFLLMMSGHESVMRNIIAFTATINVCCNAVLIPTMGLLGAAIAGAITLSLQNLLAAVMVWRLLGIWTLPIFPRATKVK